MPRPYPPPPVTPVQVLAFSIDAVGKHDLARELGLEEIPAEVCDAISHAIGCYLATCNGSRDTTVGNVVAALDEIQKEGRNYRRAVRRLIGDSDGVDYMTHERLGPLAAAVLEDTPGAREALRHASADRAEELRSHPRVETATEALRFFCGILREIFNHAAAPKLKLGPEGAWRHCRRFAIEVFALAGIPHDFDAHPERLTEYLGTDVSIRQ